MLDPGLRPKGIATRLTSLLSNFGLSEFWNFIARHRVSVTDLSLLAAVMLVLAYVAFEIDIFVTSGTATPADKTIDLNETLLLGGVFAIGLLIFATQRYVALKREIVRRIAAERQARELAYQDPLTGLANRRQFEEALSVAAASPPPGGASHAVILVDLNGFKYVNDTHGHGIGDEVLLIVAQRLLRAVRQGELVARLGGDEFAVLAPHLLGPEAAANIALRIIQGFAEPIKTGNIRHDLGAAIGISLLPDDAQSVDEAIRMADVALYRAKAERRSTFRFFEADMDRMVRERDQMERQLKQAIDQELIVPCYRPSFDLRTGKVVSFEAVPNWVTPDGTAIPPERYLPIAEETGLIFPLTRHILEKACAAALHWPSQIMLSIDVVPIQLKDPDFAGGVLDVVLAAGLAPRRLEIEIAESTIVRDLDAAKASLAPLRAAGVSIALDNFGTGYSNLYHLRELKLDKVKIDRRLTDHLGDDGARKMVQALAGLGQGLGLTVCAEGAPGAIDSHSLLKAGVQQGQSVADLISGDQAQRLANAA